MCDLVCVGTKIEVEIAQVCGLVHVEGGMSDLARVEPKVGIEFPTGLQLNQDDVVGGKSDLVCVDTKVLSMEDDSLLRYWARKTAVKGLEVLKACKVVVETLEVLEKGNKPRKTNIGMWDENFERKYSVWKITNGRFLNLKERKKIEPAKENALMDFCLTKGLLKQSERYL